MAQGKVSVCFEQRSRCFVIAYWNLVAVVVDIVCLVVIAAIVSDGFQCDVTAESIAKVDWPWLGPLLMFLNLGSQGFYACPMLLWHSEYLHKPITWWNDEVIPQQAKCYPGMVHVYLIDLLILLINVVWMKFVVAFISSIHKKDPDQMRNFFRLSLTKLILQIIHLAFAYSTTSLNVCWFTKLCDIGVATVILVTINGYINTLRREKMEENFDIPPPYVETLIVAKNPLEPAQDLTRSLPNTSMSVVADLAPSATYEYNRRDLYEISNKFFRIGSGWRAQ